MQFKVGWKKLVRAVSAWAWQEEIKVNDGVAKIEELHATPGAMEIHIEQNPAQAQYMAECFASLLKDAPNYKELCFQTSADSKEKIVVTVQKISGKTPAELRHEAELKVTRLANRVKLLEQQLLESLADPVLDRVTAR